MKRQLDHLRLQQLIPDLDIYLMIDIGKDRPHIPQPDRLAQGRRLRTGGHLSDRHSRKILDLIIMTGDALLHHLKTYQLSLYPFLLLLFQDVPGGKTLGELRDPPQPRFQRRGRVVDIIAIKTIAHFQTQRVPGPQTDRLEPLREPRFE